MAMLKNKKGKKIEDIKPTETEPSKTFQPFSNDYEKRTYHGYNRRKDAVLRMDRETQQKIKAMARMSTKQLGSNMKDVIGTVVNLTLSGFDEYHLAWYKEMLSQVQEEDELDDRKKAEQKMRKERIKAEKEQAEQNK